jgi:riboflavin kinase/FMN adenylyltransferase
VEVNLFDICDNLYGQTLTLSFIARLREERRFESEEDLISQLQHDKQLALSLQP